MSEAEARHEMIAGLDRALHGFTVARDATPQEVWQDLLSEVKALVHPPDEKDEKTDQVIDALTAMLAKFRSAK
jgi:uncharacterized alpha-E superfamily protein